MEPSGQNYNRFVSSPLQRELRYRDSTSTGPTGDSIADIGHRALNEQRPTSNAVTPKKIWIGTSRLGQTDSIKGEQVIDSTKRFDGKVALNEQSQITNDEEMRTPLKRKPAFRDSPLKSEEKAIDNSQPAHRPLPPLPTSKKLLRSSLSSKALSATKSMELFCKSKTEQQKPESQFLKANILQKVTKHNKVTKQNSAAKTAAKDELDQFLRDMGLAISEDKDKVLELGAALRATQRIMDSVNQPQAQPIPSNTALERLFLAEQPYLKMHDKIADFAARNEEVFSKWRKEAAGVDGSECERLRQLKIADFQRLTQEPSTRLRVYYPYLEDLQRLLIRALRASSSSNIIMNTTELLAAAAIGERCYQQNLENLIFVLEHPLFQRELKKSDLELCKRILGIIYGIPSEAGNVAQVFSDAHDSFKQYPAEWIELIRERVDSMGSESSSSSSQRLAERGAQLLSHCYNGNRRS